MFGREALVTMRRLRKQSFSDQGFTLVELLVSIVIAAAVTVGITTLLTSDFRANATVQRFQRLRRQASQARRFIEMEASTASRLERVNANSLRFSGVHNNGTGYTITYDLVPAGDVSQAASSFRGPFVLRRTGPPYAANGILDTVANQTSVILDGLERLSAFTVESQEGNSRGALVRIDTVEGDATYNPEFSLAVATSPAYGLLQRPKTEFLSNCTGNPSPAGCRNTQIGDRIIQEWDTRNTNSATIIPVDTPSEVIIYFDVLKPTTAGAIRGVSDDNASRCTRSRCYVFVNNTGYTLNTRIDRLVFLDQVVAVPPDTQS